MSADIAQLLERIDEYEAACAEVRRLREDDDPRDQRLVLDRANYAYRRLLDTRAEFSSDKGETK